MQVEAFRASRAQGSDSTKATLDGLLADSASVPVCMHACGIYMYVCVVVLACLVKYDDIGVRRSMSMKALVHSTITTCMARSQGQSRLLETAWRGAEAFHFFLLAHRQVCCASSRFCLPMDA